MWLFLFVCVLAAVLGKILYKKFDGHDKLQVALLVNIIERKLEGIMLLNCLSAILVLTRLS